MKIQFGYYQGLTFSEYWKYSLKRRILEWIYIQFWHICKPTKVTRKHPLASIIQILDKDGTDLTKKYFTIQEYNNKTKEVVYTKLESRKPLKIAQDENKCDILVKEIWPDSYMKLLIR